MMNSLFSTFAFNVKLRRCIKGPGSTAAPFSMDEMMGKLAEAAEDEAAPAAAA